MTEKLRQRQPNKQPPNNNPVTKETKKSENVPKDIKITTINEKKSEKGSFFGRVCAYMFEKDDSSILAAFRILWGFIMSYEVLEHILNDFSKTKASFYASNFQFKYFPFDWIPLIPFHQFQIFLWFFSFLLFKYFIFIFIFLLCILFYLFKLFFLLFLFLKFDLYLFIINLFLIVSIIDLFLFKEKLN